MSGSERTRAAGPELPFTPRPFKQAWWLPGPHAQTLAARVLRSGRDVPFCRLRVDLPDGDFVDLDFAYADAPEERSPRRPLVLVLHGLEGSARSNYALELYNALRERGLRAVGLNFRSCGGELNRLPRLYHSGDTADLSFVMSYLEEVGDAPVGIVGFSLGGNVLLKYLGERGSDGTANISAAVAISVPFDLAAGARHLERGMGRLYSSFLLRKLQRKIGAKRAMLPPTVDVNRALRATTFFEFDDAATAPIHGFDGAEDYYARSSSADYITGIRVPTLLLHSRDDPFLPARSLPMNSVNRNPAVTGVMTERGGHVGFVSGISPVRAVFWAERETARFLSLAIPRRVGGGREPGVNDDRLR